VQAQLHKYDRNFYLCPICYPIVNETDIPSLHERKLSSINAYRLLFIVLFICWTDAMLITTYFVSVSNTNLFVAYTYNFFKVLVNIDG